MARFLSFTSGSCGNCYYLEGPSGKAVLIDAGVSVRKMKTVLEQYGIGLDRIAGVLVTHEHLDHIRHLGAYCKRLSLPVWATDRQHVILSTHFATAEHIAPCRRVLAKGKWNEVAPGISARYFQVSHDAGDTVGYAITLGDHRFVLMTDLGSVPKEAMEFSRQADTVVIESNYDIDMLLGGSYPPELKQRIFRDAGQTAPPPSTPSGTPASATSSSATSPPKTTPPPSPTTPPPPPSPPYLVSPLPTSLPPPSASSPAASPPPCSSCSRQCPSVHKTGIFCGQTAVFQGSVHK